MSIKASYDVQSRRSLVERVIRTINLWRVLEDFQSDMVEEFEAWLDCICALCNLAVLDRQDRLSEIPDKDPPGVAHRIFSKLDPEPLPSVKAANGLPRHIKELLDNGPDFFGGFWRRSFRPTSMDRSISRINSCYMQQINCCAIPGGRFLIAFHAAASSQALGYIGGLVVDRNNFFLEHGCACTVGLASIEDDDSGDERPQRGKEENGGCSHIAACCELLARLQENPDDFVLVVREAKGPRLDTHFRSIPLQHALSQLNEAKQRVYIGKTPLDDRQPIPVCVCRRAREYYKGGVIVKCRVCEEEYHHKCLLLSKTAAGKLDDDWCCGFCVGACRDTVNKGNDEDDKEEQIHIADKEAEETWVILKSARKSKKQVKSPEPEKVTYRRFWTETPCYYRTSKRARVMEVRGIANWEDLSVAIAQNAAKNKTAMQRLKKAATAALKEGGHHVSDMQGMDGLQQATVTAELLDVLEDAHLLVVEDVVDQDDK